MADVKLTWDLPSVSGRQRPILETEIAIRVGPTLPWTVQDVIDVDAVQELVFVDVAPGEYFYQAVVVDVDGIRGLPVGVSIDLSFDAPGQVSNFIAVEV